MVAVNNYFQIGVQTPFGGYKESGIGREQHKAVLNFLE
jgi:acyl-CoA reductase-like NAD-dependent aldehyde dehydrogenase